MRRKIIDKMDLLILRLISEDPELTYADIAEKLKTSPVTIHNRIKKIKAYGTKKAVIIPPKIFGKEVTAFIQISTVPGKEREVGELIAKVPEVLKVRGTTGDFDLLVEVVAKDVNELQQLVMEKFRSLEGVVRTNTVLVLFTLKDELNYIPELHL